MGKVYIKVAAGEGWRILSENSSFLLPASAQTGREVDRSPIPGKSKYFNPRGGPMAASG